MKKTLLAFVAMALTGFSASAQVITYYLDLQGINGVDQVGYQILIGEPGPVTVDGPFLFESSAISLTLTGNGASFFQTTTSATVADHTLTGDSIVARGVDNGSNAAIFTFAGFNPGDTVSLYAIGSGGGDAAVLRYNGVSYDLFSAGVNPDTVGNNPTLSDFVLIADSITIDGSGSLSGDIYGRGAGGAGEGRIGGFAVVVTSAIPEPGSLALLGLGGLGALVVWRRRR